MLFRRYESKNRLVYNTEDFCKGVLRGTTVAVKKLVHWKEDALKEFLHEVKLMRLGSLRFYLALSYAISIVDRFLIRI